MEEQRLRRGFVQRLKRDVCGVWFGVLVEVAGGGVVRGQRLDRRMQKSKRGPMQVQIKSIVL